MRWSSPFIASRQAAADATHHGSATADPLKRPLVRFSVRRYNGCMVETLTPAAAADLLSLATVDLVDVRDEREFHAGHVPGARNIPLETLRADPDKFLARDKTIVFVCAKGVRSLTAAKLAERLGYANVANLDGGTSAWSKAGFALETAAISVAA